MNIEQSVTVRGSFHVDGDLVIEGTLEGKVFVTGRLVVSPSGAISGEATCSGGHLSGRLSGVLHSDRPVQVDPGAVVAGRIMAPALDFSGEGPGFEAMLPDATAPRTIAAQREALPRDPVTVQRSRSAAPRPPAVTGDRSQIIVKPTAALGESR